MEKPTYFSLVFLLLFVKLQTSAITYSIAKPLLEELSDGHTLVGQKLIVKCTFRYRGQFTMDWDVPNENGIENRKIHFGKLTKTENEDEYFQDLEIENTTIADQGQYTCTVRSSLHVNNATKMIRIFDSTEHFINLTEENGVYDKLIRAGTPRVQWRININAYPKPILIWYDNNDEEIQTGWIPHNNPKYNVMESSSFKKTFLTINNITIFDRGYYKLKAISGFEEKTIQLFLNVTNDDVGFGIQRSDEKEKDLSELHKEINEMLNSARKRGFNKDFDAKLDKQIKESPNIYQIPVKKFSFPEFPKSNFINTEEVEQILKIKPQFEIKHTKSGSLGSYVVILFLVPLLIVLLKACFSLKNKDLVK